MHEERRDYRHVTGHAHDIPHPSPVTDWPVNAALRAIGVDRGDHLDEAAALSLTLPR